MQLNTFVKDVSSKLQIGQSSPYLTCPICGRTKKFGVTRYADRIAYQCFSASCGTRGYLNSSMSKEALSSLLNKAEVLSSRKEFIIPEHWITGFGNQEAYDMANKYGLVKPYSDGVFRTYTDFKLMRQVFPYFNQAGHMTGGNGRALLKSMAKSYIYPDSLKYPQVVGSFKEAVVVEDFFSVVKAYLTNRTGISLSGTNLQNDWLSWFKKYDRIYICLDKDATLKAFQMKKILDYFCSSVIILPLTKDLKDMSVEQANSLFESN